MDEVATQLPTKQESPYTLSIGQGRQNPQVENKKLIMNYVQGEWDVVMGYCEAINTLIPATTEAYFATHTWKNNHRKKENWVDSWGVGIDLDYSVPKVNEKGERYFDHVAVPPELAQQLDTLAKEKKLPGNIYYRTPRGIRLIYNFRRIEMDKKQFEEMAEGVRFQVETAIHALALMASSDKAGLLLDQSVYKDTARLLYAPKAIVDGIARDGEAIPLEEKPYAKDEFLAWAKEAAAKKAAALPKVRETTTKTDDRDEPEVELLAAILAHNRDYLEQQGRWPQPGSGTCPICAHNACFGYLPEDPDRWYCFSANHTPEVGMQKEGSAGYFGDALDLVIFKQGWTGQKTRAEALQVLKDPKGKPYLSAKYQAVNFRGLKVERYLFDMAEGKYRLRDPVSQLWEHHYTRDAVITELTHLGLNKKSLYRFLSAIPSIHSEEYLPNNPEEFVKRGELTVLNTYKPTSLTPEQGDFSLIQKLLLNLCSGRNDYVTWLIEYLARIAQDLRAKTYARMGVSITMKGRIQGTGKNVFATILGAVFGEKNVFVGDQTSLEGNFNSQFENRLFIIGNEVFTNDNRHNKTVANKIKAYVTDDTYELRRKYFADATKRNWANWFFFSNEDVPYILEREERRSTVFCTQEKLDPALGALLAEDARAHGPIVRAFYYHLLEQVKPAVERYVALQTEDKQDMISKSGHSGEKFAEELVQHGIHSDLIEPWQKNEQMELYRLYQLNETRDYFNPMVSRPKDGAKGVPRSTMTAIYKLWAVANGYKYVSAEKLFPALRTIAKMKDEDFWLNGKKVRVFTNVPERHHSPDPDDSRQADTGQKQHRDSL